MADPFAAAGFAPADQSVPAAVAADPFAAAGFAATGQQQAPMTTKEAPSPYFGVGALPTLHPGPTPEVPLARGTEKIGEGATFGMFPYIAAAGRYLTGTPWEQALQQSRAYTAETSKQAPMESAVLEGTGALLPTTGIINAARPITQAISRIPAIGSSLAQALLGGTIGGASAAGHDIGAGQTENLPGDIARGAGVGGAIGAAAPVVGTALQAAPNLVRGAYGAVRNVFTSPGKDAVAGQILREAGGDFANTAARSPLPDLSLRTAQATGNPGIAALERTMASEPGGQAGLPGQIVQNGRTSDQTQALAKALVGSDAGIEPAVLTSQASASGTEAIQNARSALRQAENSLWNAPELSSVKLKPEPLIAGVQQDVASMPPSFRRTIQQGPLAGFMEDISAIPQGAPLAEVNAIRSRILEQARASRASGDSVTGSAAQQLADSLLTRTEGALGNVGAPIQEAWQTARDFTRQRAQAFGFPQFDAILEPNAAGNMRADPTRAFGQFFDLHGSSGTGLQRLQTVYDLLRATGTPEANAAAQQLQGATQGYLKASVLGTARAGAGLDAAGRPNINPATLASTVNRAVPAISGTPIAAPVAGDIQAAGNAAELLNRPASLRGDMNSTTFEKLRNRDLVGAILGQTGASSLGALTGGYAAGRYGPEEVPLWARVPGGMLAGALLGNRVGPYVGRVAAHIPGASLAVSGPTSDIMRRVSQGLADPAEYQRLLQAYMPPTTQILAPGAISQAAPLAARAAIPLLTNGARQ